MNVATILEERGLSRAYINVNSMHFHHAKYHAFLIFCEQFSHHIAEIVVIILAKLLYM